MTREIVSGIYQIVGPNDHRYVGSAVDITERWWTHRTELRSNRHHSCKLQNAWNKYGEEAFSFSILEIVPDKSKLLEVEDRWIKTTRGVVGNRRLYNTNETPYSRLGMAHSEDTRRRIAQSKNGGKTYTVIDPSNNVYSGVINISEFCASHDIGFKAITRVMRGERRFDSGWTGFVECAADTAQEYQDKIERAIAGREEGRITKAGNDKMAFSQSGGKAYTVITADDIVYADIINLASFCKQHSISITTLRKTVSGEADHACGWIVYLQTDNLSLQDMLLDAAERRTRRGIGHRSGVFGNSYRKLYTLVSPDYVEYSNVSNLREFCRNHGLQPSAMCVVAQGKRPHHKGWTGYIQS